MMRLPPLPGSVEFSRRGFFLAAGSAVLPLASPQDSLPVAEQPAGQLQNPEMVGMPRQRITDYENDPFIIGIESRLACTCGCTLDVYTCRTTDFTCGTSPAMHKEVVQLAQQEKTAEEIVDAFVAKYGETVLMAPPKEGFNIVGYVLPGLGIFGVGVGILIMLMVRTRRAVVPATVGGSLADSPPSVSDDEAALLEREMKELDL